MYLRIQLASLRILYLVQPHGYLLVSSGIFICMGILKLTRTEYFGMLSRNDEPHSAVWMCQNYGILCLLSTKYYLFFCNGWFEKFIGIFRMFLKKREQWNINVCKKLSFRSNVKGFEMVSGLNYFYFIQVDDR